MAEPTTTSEHLLGRPLPVQIASYVVERLLSGGPGYADYDAHHRTLGHGLLFRHERWPSRHGVRGSRSALPSWTSRPGCMLWRACSALADYRRRCNIRESFRSSTSSSTRVNGSRCLRRFPRPDCCHEIITAIQNDHRPPYSIAEFVGLCAGVTDGLAAIHRAGFVHRTLGTHNIVVDSHRSGPTG